MALSADQRAMLQLLLERGQSYGDLAGLLDASEEEVARRARAALTELAGEDPDAEVGLTDYLLGEADPIGRADAVRQLQADPAALATAEELVAKLRVIAPDAELPELPAPRRRRRARAKETVASAAPAEAAAKTEAGPLSGITPRQGRLFVALGASAVLLVAIVLAITGAFGGGEEDSAATTPTATTAADGSVQTEELTRVQLQAQGASDAAGTAIFGLATNDQPFLDLDIEGLPPASQDQTYVVWFLLSEKRGYPLAPLTPSVGGEVTDRFAIPQVVLPIAVRTQFVDVSLVDDRALAQDLQQALRGQQVLLPYQGESVLRGRIPEGEQGTAGAAPGG